MKLTLRFHAFRKSRQPKRILPKTSSEFLLDGGKQLWCMHPPAHQPRLVIREQSGPAHQGATRRPETSGIDQFIIGARLMEHLVPRAGELTEIHCARNIFKNDLRFGRNLVAYKIAATAGAKPEMEDRRATVTMLRFHRERAISFLSFREG